METKEIYRKLIKQVLVENEVETIIYGSDAKEQVKIFDKVQVTTNGDLEVYSHGLSKPLKNFYFDYTCDYARCLSYIEDEIFLQKHGGNSLHGYHLTFKTK